MKTPAQKKPLSFVATVDLKTAGALAVHADSSPAAYASGLLMQLVKTADAIGVKPQELLAAAVLAYCAGTV